MLNLNPTRIWRETKGKATATERIVILSVENPFENNQRLSGKSVLQYDQIKGSTKHFMRDLTARRLRQGYFINKKRVLRAVEMVY